MSAPAILIIEDEDALTTLLRYNLKKEGYIVRDTANGVDGLDMIDADPPDLLILDWMLPGVSGLEICRHVRRNPKTAALPILMLTARTEENDRVRGLETGADDYVSKPFSMPELQARIKALLRRSAPAPTKGVLTYHDVSMDLDSHRVTRGGRIVHLGPKEFRLLQFLMLSPGKVFSREDLLNAVWGMDIYVELRTVDVHILRLRKALSLGDDPPRCSLIRTVRTAGYALEASESPDA